MNDAGMILCIDAVNINSGGGLTHLAKMLEAAEPADSGIQHIHIWTSKYTASRLPCRKWLTVHAPGWTDSKVVIRMLCQQIVLPLLAIKHGCKLMFCPGGVVPLLVTLPVITMSQNMLPFESAEAKRFGIMSTMWFKLRILRKIQGRAFRRADGLIFLTNYARESVTRALGRITPHVALVPHGIEERFLIPPRTPRLLSQCSIQKPFRVLYVSILMPYKHQIEVAKAATLLRNKGLPIEMCFIGASWGEYGKRFGELLTQLDPTGQFLKWTGHEPFESVHKMYGEADVFVFASSCENLPNIMIEAMAASLPIASSRKGPMPEVLGDAGVYFDPECPNSIAESIEHLANNADLRANLSWHAHNLAKEYSWQQCASHSLEFFVSVAKTIGK